MKKIFFLTGLIISIAGINACNAQTYKDVPALLTNATKEITIGLNNHELPNVLRFGPMDTWNAYSPDYMGKYKAFGHVVNYDVLTNDKRSDDPKNVTISYDQNYYLIKDSKKVLMKNSIGSKNDEFRYFVASLNGSDYVLRIKKDFIK